MKLFIRGTWEIPIVPHGVIISEVKGAVVKTIGKSDVLIVPRK
jgi:hypothetical protein